MKNKCYQWLLALFLALNLVAVSTPASAYYYYYHHYYHPYYYGHHCRWVSGFWAHGYWHPAQRVCWYR